MYEVFCLWWKRRGNKADINIDLNHGQMFGMIHRYEINDKTWQWICRSFEMLRLAYWWLVTDVSKELVAFMSSGIPRNFFRGNGGVRQILLRTEDRENGDLGAVAP